MPNLILTKSSTDTKKVVEKILNESQTERGVWQHIESSDIKIASAKGTPLVSVIGNFCCASLRHGNGESGAALAVQKKLEQREATETRYQTLMLRIPRIASATETGAVLPR